MRRIAILAALVLGLGLAAPAAAHAAPNQHERTASSSTEKYYRTYGGPTSSSLTQCQVDQLLYPRGSEYEGGIIDATTCFYVINGLYQLMITVEYNGQDPLIQLNDTCTGDEDAPFYPSCEGVWEAGSSNYSYVYTQGSGNHSLTHLTWVPYPSAPSWGWLKDPNGQALAYYNPCGCLIMYNTLNVWWELFQQVTTPDHAGFWHVPIAIDSNNNATDGWCLHFIGDAGLINMDLSYSSCYGTIPQPDTWAAPYN